MFCWTRLTDVFCWNISTPVLADQTGCRWSFLFWTSFDLQRFDFAIKLPSLATQKLKTATQLHFRRHNFMANEDRINLIYPEISTGCNRKSGNCWNSFKSQHTALKTKEVSSRRNGLKQIVSHERFLSNGSRYFVLSQNAVSNCH